MSESNVSAILNANMLRMSVIALALGAVALLLSSFFPQRLGDQGDKIFVGGAFTMALGIAGALIAVIERKLKPKPHRHKAIVLDDETLWRREQAEKAARKDRPPPS